MLKQFIEQLSRDLEFSNPPKISQDNSYLLVFEEDTEISLSENPESGITLFARLSPLPTQRVEDFLQYLLSSNLFGRETGGNILGVDKEGKNVTLTSFLSSQITYKQFYEALEDFLNYAESWRLEALQFAHPEAKK